MIPTSTPIAKLKASLRDSWKDFPVDDTLQYLSLAIDEVFGYASLDLDAYLFHQAAIDAYALEQGWKVEVGVLSVAFFRGGFKIELKFGEKPDKKQLKVLVNESKEKKKRNDTA